MSRRLLPIIAGTFLLACGTPAVRAQPEDPPPFPEGVVARAGGRDVTFEDLCLAAAEHERPLLRTWASASSVVLRELIEEQVVQAVCSELGHAISDADVEARIRETRESIHARSNGSRTLEDVLRAED
ncbi:MAG: hypothetical protein ACYTG6_16000, partial [Planctomycetota bacterium]